MTLFDRVLIATNGTRFGRYLLRLRNRRNSRRAFRRLEEMATNPNLMIRKLIETEDGDLREETDAEFRARYMARVGKANS